jgi:quinol-cytochrome oxidoreductase complex cytochrome b subunit
VLLLPLALGALLYAHIALYESHGIAPPATSDPLQRRRFTEREDKKNVPFMPHIFFYITKWALLYIGLLLGIAALWPWTLPTYVGNLSAVGVVTEPDWYFLWLFKLVDFQGVTPVIAVGITTALMVYILFLPFLDRSKRTHPRDRPLFIFLATSLLEFFVLMTAWGGLTPGIAITPMVVVERIAPLFLVNAVVTGLFYWRYQRSYRARLAAREGRTTDRAGAYPVPSVARPSVAEAKPHD